MGLLSMMLGISTPCWENCALCHNIFGGGGKTVTDDETYRLLHSSLSIPMEKGRNGKGTGLNKLNYFGRVRIEKFMTPHRRAYAAAGKVRCSRNSSTCHR
jgi:hypothetical protein